MPPGPNTDRPEVRFVLQSDDLIAAQRCSYANRPRKPSSLVWVAVAVLALSVVVSFGMPDASFFWRALVLGGAVLYASLGPLVTARWRIPRAAKHLFHQQRSLHREMILSWDEDELRYGSDRGDSRTAFVDYLRWAESGDVILLYLSDALFHFIPKRVLEPVQIEDLRSIARRVNMKGI